MAPNDRPNPGQRGFDYLQLTKRELMALARERLIRGRSRMNKSQLARALRRSETEEHPTRPETPSPSSTEKQRGDMDVVEPAPATHAGHADTAAGPDTEGPASTDGPPAEGDPIAGTSRGSDDSPRDHHVVEIPDLYPVASTAVASEPAPPEAEPARPDAAVAPPSHETVSTWRERKPELATPPKRGIAAATVTIGSLYERDGTTPPVQAKWVLGLVITYIVLARVISDRFVLPLGASIRLYEVVLVLIAGAWVLWMVVEPLPLPFGLPAITGLFLILVVALAPFIHGPTLNAYQANGAERGLFRMFTFIGLFLAAYHLAFRIRQGLTVLAAVVAATAGQAVVAIYEKLTAQPVAFLDTLATSIGLVPDPLSVRLEEEGIFQRLSGEVRAVSTAPHPIVLSAVIAVGVLVAGVWLLHTKRVSTRAWLAFAGAILVLSLPVANSRTGFVILAALAAPLLVLMIDKVPAMLLWSLPLFFMMSMAFALSPETPRLLLNSFTDPGSDQNTPVRLERFERIPELLDDRPFVGAGYLTHDPQIQFFDNAYNLALIELGIIGLAAVVSFFIACLVRSWAGAVRAGPSERILPVVGVIGALALLAGGATFDAWSFEQFFPTCLILIGLGLGRTAVVMRRDNAEEIVVHLPAEKVPA
jgi:hypothetical protein